VDLNLHELNKIEKTRFPLFALPREVEIKKNLHHDHLFNHSTLTKAHVSSCKRVLKNRLQELFSGNGSVLMCPELMTWQIFQNLTH
jgi:hypothetical protein